MDILLLLLAFPLLWPFIAKQIWRNDLNWTEIGINTFAAVSLTSLVFLGGKMWLLTDYEILNGAIESKTREKVSCTHSYKCKCVQVCSNDAKGNRSCTEICSTCYDHDYDVDWRIHSTIGTTFLIDRIDRQGIEQPPRWTTTMPGQPYAVKHAYDNYIAAADRSLFNFDSQLKEKYRDLLPQYPLDVYDYHYINRVLPVGVSITDLTDWNYNVGLLLRNLGPSKQVNLIIVAVKSSDRNYANALRSEWLGGKKNDVIVVLGTPNYPNIEWVEIISWTDAQLFKVELRDELQDLKVVDKIKVLSIIENKIGTKFVRKHMRDFEYLKKDIQPPLWLLILAGLGGVVISLGLTYYFSRQNVNVSFDGIGSTSYRRKSYRSF